MKKAIPKLRTDEEAERFIETADLTEYDLSGFVPASFRVLIDAKTDEASAGGDAVPALPPCPKGNM